MSEVHSLTSIIVLTDNNLQIARQCLQSIYLYTELVSFELIIVDNASKDGTPDYLLPFSDQHPNCKIVLNDEKIGLATAYNQGAAIAIGEYLVFLNGDTFVTPNWLPGLLRLLDEPGVGMAGPATNATDVETYISVDYVDMEDMLVFTADYMEAHSGKIRKVKSLPFLCVVIRLDVFRQIGKLDEQFKISMYDDDYAIRLRETGYSQYCAEDVFVHHWKRAEFSWEEEKNYWESFTKDKDKLEQKWNIKWQPSRYRNEYLDEQIQQMWIEKYDLALQVIALRTELFTIQQGFAWKILENFQLKTAEFAPKRSRRAAILESVTKLLIPFVVFLDRMQKLLLPKWEKLKQQWHLRRLRKRMHHELEIILTQSVDIRDIIVFVPTIFWKAALFQRPHQLALALAKKNCLVFFCEPAKSKEFVGQFAPITENLYVVGPAPLDIFKTIPSPIVFTLAYNRSDLDYFTHPRVVYEYIDELSVFYGSPKILKRNHEALVQDAEVVLATAENLFNEIYSLRPDALMNPNAADITFIRREIDGTMVPPEDLRTFVESKQPIVGYYGALAKWFDYRLLKRVAILQPDWHFVLIGLDYDGSVNRSKVLDVPNIHWLGTKPYVQIPSYLKYFDVATIPFRLNEITHATSPLKLFEYMAGGKPIVTTAMHECQKYPPVLIAEDADDFTIKLDEALLLRSDQAYQKSLAEWAEKNTWERRATQILAALPARSGDING